MSLSNALDRLLAPVDRASGSLWDGVDPIPPATERDVAVVLNPHRTGVLFMIDADSDEYLAVCDPKKPHLWRTPLVFRHLLAKAKEGHVVVAKAGTFAWRVYSNGETAPWA